MSVLIWVEHEGGAVKDATLAVVTAAGKLGDVVALVAGSGVGGVAEETARIVGISKVLLADNPAFEHALPENLAPLIVGLMAGHEAFLAPATSTGKNVAPRVAALLDVMQVSDILSVEASDTFTRPIYAGNAIATVQSLDNVKVITVRGTAFEKASREGGSAPVEAVSSGGETGLATFVSAEISKSERPELTSAKIIVSGGRALGSSEQFHQVIDPLADKLLTSAALISLVQMDLAQSWMVAVIIGREFAVTTLRSLAYARGVAMPASPLGKIKMVSQVVAILALILAHGQMWPFYFIGQAALWVVVVTALVSGADYFRRFNTILSPRVADIRVARDQRAPDRKAG